MTTVHEVRMYLQLEETDLTQTFIPREDVVVRLARYLEDNGYTPEQFQNSTGPRIPGGTSSTLFYMYDVLCSVMEVK